MKKTKLVVLVSGGGRTAENLHTKIQENLNSYISISLVIASSSKIKAFNKLKSIGLNVEIVPESDQLLIERIKKEKADFIILAGWLKLFPIPPDFAGKVINIHPSLLPDFGGKGFWGLKVHTAVINSKVKKSGCTVHFANENYDEGDIILQRTCQVYPTDTPSTLANRVFNEECIALPEAIIMLANRKTKNKRN